MIDIVITCKNYGRYLADAIDSCLAQSVPCNIIVVNDGSTDETASVMARYHEDITAVLTAGVGLAAAANAGIQRGESSYVCRLDADDWLHPDFCLVMEGRINLASRPAFVYCDYFDVTNTQKELDYFDVTNTQKELLWPTVKQDAAPLGSCMVYRRDVYDGTGGYDESLTHQEDYDFWLRLRDYPGEHISIALWYYRKHAGQMSSAWNRRQSWRRAIKEKHGTPDPRVLAVIPARGNSKGVPGKNKRDLGGIPLVSHAIRLCKSCKVDMLIAVSTEDTEIAKIARREGVAVIVRPPALAEDDISTIPVAIHAMKHMDQSGYHADIVVSVQPTAPFTTPESLREAIALVSENKTQCAVSVSEIRGTHPYRAYELSVSGCLSAMFQDAEKYLQRQDRPKAYGFTGGFYVRRRILLDSWSGKDFALGMGTRGVLVPPEASLDIDDEIDFKVAETVLKYWSKNQ